VPRKRPVLTPQAGEGRKSVHSLLPSPIYGRGAGERVLWLLQFLDLRLQIVKAARGLRTEGVKFGG